MTEVRVDHKGKVFSIRVDKNTLHVIIATERHTVIGFVYVRPGNRLKDELNDEERFIAVSDAQVFDMSGTNLLYKTHFMAMDKTHILWVLPTDELVEDSTTEPSA